MPLFGKGKGKQKEDPAANIEAAEEDGLLMAVKAEVQRPPSQEKPPAEAPAQDDDPSASDAAQGDDIEDNLAPAASEDEDEAGDGVEKEDAAAQAEPKDGADGADDLLAAFKDEGGHSDLGALVEGVPDILATELLAELREFRAMIPGDASVEEGEAA